MIQVCTCGKEFNVRPAKVKIGHGKYCSRICSAANATRPKGLKYNIVKENPAWIKPGQRLSPNTEFQKGEVPWHKGTHGVVPQGENHPSYKGDSVGYSGLHDWVRRHRGKATACENCGSTHHVEWANKSHEYKRELDDWLPLCKRCHAQYDKHHRGAIRRRFI